MPTRFCYLPYISIIYWKLHMSCLKIFSPICRYLCEMFGVVLLVIFILPMIYPLSIAEVVVSYLCVYLRCWVAKYAYSWINICRGWTNNGNTRQYRIKTVCVGCTERTLVVSFVILMFVLRCANVSALQIVLSKSLYESTAKWETYQIFKEDRLLVRI